MTVLSFEIVLFVSVRPSYLRSNFTGNPIRLGLFSKTNLTVKTPGYIGAWDNSTVICLNKEESIRKIAMDPTRQFYSLTLHVNKNIMKTLRTGK